MSLSKPHASARMAPQSTGLPPRGLRPIRLDVGTPAVPHPGPPHKGATRGREKKGSLFSSLPLVGRAGVGVVRESISRRTAIRPIPVEKHPQTYTPSWSEKADHPCLWCRCTEARRGSSAFAEDDGEESPSRRVGIISLHRGGIARDEFDKRESSSLPLGIAL
jgi:hypothetical protein